MRQSLIFLVLLLFSLPVKAQFIFTKIQPKNGLSSKAVTSIYKDDEGFVWLGTFNGVNRYDGSNVKLYNLAVSSINGLGNSAISCITGLGKGKIWIGTQKGLLCFNKITDTFKTIPFVDENNNPVIDVNVTTLTTNGKWLWIGTGKGMFILQDEKALPVSKVFKNATVIDKAACSLACVLDEGRKGIWIGTQIGLYFLNYATGEMLSAKNNPQHPIIFLTDTVVSLAKDAHNNLWVSSTRHPMALYDFATNTFSEVKYFDDAHRWKINLFNPAMFQDSYGRLWISSEYTRIFVLQPDKKFSILPDESPPEYKLGYGSFSCVYEDAERNIWIGTPNGAFKLSATNPLLNIVNFPGHLPQPFVEDLDINFLAKKGDHQWWLCKEDGIYSYNDQSGETERFMLNAKKLVHLRSFAIEPVDGEWWCGTRDGIQILNLATKKFRPFTYYAKGHEVRNRSAYWIHKDRRGFVWFAAWADAIYRFDPATKQTIRFDGSNPAFGDIQPVNSLCVLEANDGKMWFGLGEKGLRVFDYATNRFSNPVNKPACVPNFDTLIVSNLFEDKDHNILLSTLSEGILKISPNRECSKFITTENGLPSNKTNCIFIDKNNTAWTAIDGNIYYLKPGSKNVSVIKVNLDLPVHDAWSSIESADDKLLITIVDRLITVDLSKINVPIPETPTLISRISVFEKEMPFSSLQRSIDLNYDQNFFSIEFSSPVDNEHSSVQYAYKLNGFDKDWVYCGTRQIAAYTNVPHGHYTFLVKSTKDNGEWSKLTSEIKIVVTPPFFKTGWFALLIAVVLCLLAWRLRKIILKRRQKKTIDNTIDYFANSVYGQNSVNEICWDIARNCISQLKLEDCVVYLLDEEKNLLVQKAAFGPKNPKGHEIINPLEIEPGKGIVGTVAATCKPLLIKDTRKDSRYIMDDENRLSELAVPILHEGKLMGVIDSEHSKENFFTPAHQKALTTIASISSNKIAEAKAEAAATENELQLLEINKLLAESQLMALRTQMNPHFVFNCLNSIQECIVTEKYPEAITYLNKFSKLFRSILNNSSKVYVSLQEEVEVLDLYLELELMRFEKSFSYKIIVDDELDEDIELPSMLLQPYVENALWHGLMHKEGDKKLTIEFKSIDEETFQCIIDDNGIGRKKSFELKEQQSKTKHHQSKGMRITKDRIDLLKRQGNHASLEIIDKEENGTATGTRVIIELSAFLK